MTDHDRPSIPGQQRIAFDVEPIRKRPSNVIPFPVQKQVPPSDTTAGAKCYLGRRQKHHAYLYFSNTTGLKNTFMIFWQMRPSEIRSAGTTSSKQHEWNSKPVTC